MAKDDSAYSRRDFIKIAGTTIVGLSIGCGTSRRIETDEVAIIPVSEGYLIVDKKKCSGCYSCMLACSLVHHGRENLSLARIQVVQNPFEPFPGDIFLAQCRQCVEPPCVEVCPVEPIKALRPDPNNGNVRIVDYELCVGCQACVMACPYEPSRAIWNFEEDHAEKCDLCANARYWGKPGGPTGQQACVSVCPMEAIAFVREIPAQEGDAGYDKNLRGETWQQLGFSVQD